MKLEVYSRPKQRECMGLVGNKPLIYMEITDNSKECLTCTFSLMYVQVALATSDVRSILENTGN